MKKKSKSSVLNMIERERHRVAANVTQENEWSQHEPNNGLGRMFIVMLLLHVFVIGGIILYDFMGSGSSSNTQSSSTPERPTPAPAAQPAPAMTPAAANANAAALPRPTSTTTPAVNPAALIPTTAAPANSHLVVAHETLDTIAAQHGVDKAALIALNQLDNNGQTTLQSGVRLALPPPSAKVPASSDSVPVAIPVTPTEAAARSLTPPAASIPLTEPDAPTSKAPAVTADKASNTAQTEQPKKPETKVATEPKPKASEPEPRRVVITQPRPVATPSDARRALANTEAKNTKRTGTTSTAKKPSTTANTESKKKATATAPSRVTIAKGDTLYSIARKYNLSATQIQKLNNIKDPGKLQLGKTLVLR